MPKLPLCVQGLQEPDLSEPIATGFKSTWGDKKRLCKFEACSAYEEGLAMKDNPYIEGGWPHAWWEHFFNECVTTE